MLADVVSTALQVSVQLGLPVVVLFVIGLLSHRSAASSSSSPVQESGGGRGATGRPGGDGELRSGDGPGACWEQRGCEEKKRDSCPATRRADLPCWQAVKLSLGRLNSDCLDCERFVAPPVRP